VEDALTIIPSLELDAQRTSSWSCVVSVDGELDRLTAPSLSELLQEEMADERIRRLVVDLRDVEFMDGRGLSVLLDASEAMRESGRRFCVVCTDPHVLRLFTLIDVRGRLDVVRSRSTALGDTAA
jgi:anti-sigma B factor antagonist